MSFMKGDLLTKTRKLVKGLAKAEPVWYKAMEQAPPPTFPRADAIQRITLPEDVYIKKFFKKHPDSKHEDAIKISAFDPPPARIFGLRVLELKEQGVSEQEAMAVADMEYRAEKKAKKAAFVALKKIARQQGKRPPPNPYPSAIKEIQAGEKKYVYDRFHNPRIRQILRKLQEENAIEYQDRMRAGWGGGGSGGVGGGGDSGGWVGGSGSGGWSGGGSGGWGGGGVGGGSGGVGGGGSGGVGGGVGSGGWGGGGSGSGSVGGGGSGSGGWSGGSGNGGWGGGSVGVSGGVGSGGWGGGGGGSGGVGVGGGRSGGGGGW